MHRLTLSIVVGGLFGLCIAVVVAFEEFGANLLKQGQIVGIFLVQCQNVRRQGIDFRITRFPGHSLKQNKTTNGFGNILGWKECGEAFWFSETHSRKCRLFLGQLCLDFGENRQVVIAQIDAFGGGKFQIGGDFFVAPQTKVPIGTRSLFDAIDDPRRGRQDKPKPVCFLAAIFNFIDGRPKGRFLVLNVPGGKIVGILGIPRRASRRGIRSIFRVVFVIVVVKGIVGMLVVSGLVFQRNVLFVLFRCWCCTALVLLWIKHHERWSAFLFHALRRIHLECGIG